jgi:hypothetical protein
MPDADCGNKPAFYHRQLEHESDPTGMLNKKLALQVFPLLRHQTNRTSKNVR